MFALSSVSRVTILDLWCWLWAERIVRRKHPFNFSIMLPGMLDVKPVKLNLGAIPSHRDANLTFKTRFVLGCYRIVIQSIQSRVECSSVNRNYDKSRTGIKRPHTRRHPHFVTSGVVQCPGQKSLNPPHLSPRGF